MGEHYSPEIIVLFCGKTSTKKIGCADYISIYVFRALFIILYLKINYEEITNNTSNNN